MKPLPIPRDWRDIANRYFEIFHRLASGPHSDIVMRRANAFATRLKTRYKEEICYEFFMWRVLTLENLRFYRDSSDVPTALDFDGEDSVAAFIDGLKVEYSKKYQPKQTCRS
ncbi:MAG: hypothetical protein WC767_00720 [Candidatus Paceibacterota bacterium]|jgi:hypothetical protein